jgi:hypothetical protein
MPMQRGGVAWQSFLVGPLLAFATGASWSQVVYLCSVEGRTYYSVQPCPSSPAPAGPVAPTTRETRPSGSAFTKAPEKPGEHLQQQSAACAELSEAMRTGSSRGLGPSTQQQLRDAYGRLCGDDESRAGEQPNEKSRQRDLREQEAKTARLEQDREKLTREQCAEMLRIAQGKRQRLDAMTAGERADFDRFDATRRARCGV